MDLTGQTVLIIGGSSGIGQGIAAASASAGAALIIASRTPGKLDAARRQIGADVRALAVDVTSEESIASLMADIESLDHLVVSAGRSTDGPFLQLPTSAAREDFDINFWGKYLAARYAAPRMRSTGSIVFISGAYSRKANGDAVVTSASCSATESMGRALAIALAPIRVNTIAPGLVDTPLIMPDATDADRAAVLETYAGNWPTKNVGRPADIAQVALLLMTNPFMTGATIRIDGGYTIV